MADTSAAALLRGIAWMIVAAFFYASASGVVRFLSADFPTMQLVFVRVAISVVVLVPLMLRVGVPGLATRRWRMHAARTLFSVIGTSALFLALAKMPMADVSALIFTQPLMTMILAILVLRQEAGWKSWLACAIGFSGALVILRPGYAEVSWAALIALASAFTYACATTTIKSLTETDSIAAITVYPNVMMLPIVVVPAILVWTPPALADWPWLIALGVLYTFAQYAIAKGIAAADARVVQPFDFLRLPFAALIGYLLFRELPDAWTWAGAAIIFAASTYVLRLESRPTQAR